MYLEYHELLKKYKDAERNYYDALDRKTKLLYSVTPHGTEAKPIVNHLSNLVPDEQFNIYTREIQEVDLLINSTRKNRDELEYELKKKEKTLRESKNIYDRIYVYVWLEHKKIPRFYRLLGLSQRQTYNYKDEIEEKLYPGLKEKRQKLKEYQNIKREEEQKKWEKVFKK